MISLEKLFSLTGQVALAGWILLAVGAALQWRTLIAWLPGLFIPASLAVAYAGLIAAFWHDAEGNFRSLVGIASLFRSPGVLLAGWIHYLAFDLLVGVMVVDRIEAEHLPRLLLVVLLPLTLLFGPIGFLALQATRLVTRTLRSSAASSLQGPRHE